MIENATIITGSPEQAQSELRQYLASHPNATVLSSSVTVHQQLTVCSGTLESTEDPPAKGNKKAKPAEITGIAKADSTPITTVLIVAGIAL